MQHKLAFVLGWLGYHSAHQHFGDAYGQTESGLPEEKGIYYDAILLRELSAGSQKTVKAEELESLFLQMMPRILTRFHTLIPDYDDVEGWIMRMADWRVNMENYFSQLARAYASPDAGKMKKYANTFYNPKDPVIQMAQSENAKKNVEGAVQAAKSQSRYAQAVAETYQYFQTVNNFMEGDLDISALRKSLFSV